jgi:hypothetical protein
MNIGNGAAEMTFRKWDELSEVEQLQSTVYEAFKDAYGFRNRSEMSSDIDVLKAELERLAKIIGENEAARNLEEQEAVKRFEARVQYTIDSGAKNRETAIRWIFEAENDQYVFSDPDYFCYNNGLPYGYFKEVA